MTNSTKFLESKIDSGLYWTNYLGVSRSLLSLGLILTLIFNDNDVLFSYGINNDFFLKCDHNNSLSIYCLINNTILAKYISILILFFVIIGIYPRLTCVFHWWVTYSFSTSSYVIDGGDQIASILTLLLIPICLLDRRKWHWSISHYKHNFLEKNIAFFSYTLISIQAFTIYFHAMIGKFGVNEWLNGTAIYYWLLHPVFGMNDRVAQYLVPFLKIPTILLAITWSVLAIELFLSANIFISNRKVKFISLYFGTIFHLSIIIAHGLVSFFFSMTSLLLIYLISKNYNYDTTWNNRFYNNFSDVNNIFRFSTKIDKWNIWVSNPNVKKIRQTLGIRK